MISRLLLYSIVDHLHLSLEVAVCQNSCGGEKPCCMLRSSPIKLIFRQQRTLKKLNITKMLASKEEQGQERKEDEGRLPNLYSLDRPKDVLSGVTDVG